MYVAFPPLMYFAGTTTNATKNDLIKIRVFRRRVLAHSIVTPSLPLIFFDFLFYHQSASMLPFLLLDPAAISAQVVSELPSLLLYLTCRGTPKIVNTQEVINI